MNPRKYVPLLVLYCALLSNSSVHSSVENKLPREKNFKVKLVDKNNEVVNAHLPNNIKEAAETLLEVCRCIDNAFNNIALIIGNNQLSKKVSKEKTIQKIMESRTLITMIMNSSAAEINNPQQLALFVEIVSMVLDQIKTALASNFIDFPDLALEHLLAQKSQLQEVAFDQLSKKIVTLKQKSTTLEQSSEKVGLTKVNIAFRALERFNKQYYIGTIAQKALWFTGIAAIGLYLMNKGMFKKSMIFMGAKEKIKKTSLIGTANTSKSNSRSTMDEIAEANNAFNGKPMDLGLDYSSMWLPLRAVCKPLGSFKNFAGDELIPNLGASNTPNRGGFTRMHVLATAIFGFSLNKIEIGQMAQKHIVETWHYFKTKFLQARAQVAAKLRGGPAYEVADQRMLMKNPTRTLDDVIGNEQIKKELQPLIDYIVNYEQYDRKGLIPETGILFCGPPRTGKTFMGEAIAGSVRKKLAELGKSERLSFVTITPSLMKNWGENPQTVALNIQKFFFEARSMGPIIIFIDELDTGRFQRDGDAQAVEGLLAALSQLNIDKSEKVIFIGATNTPENIDIALRQSGRFGTSIYFDYPTTEEKFTFMYQALAKKAVVMDKEFMQFLYQSANEAHKATFDTLELAITAAHMQAHAEGISLNQDLLEDAIDRKHRKIQKESFNTMDEQSKIIIAHHLSGQILLNSTMSNAAHISKATLYPRAPKEEEKFLYARYDKDARKMTKNAPLRYGKVFKTKFVSRTKIASPEHLIAQAKFYLSGHIAEQILMGSSSYSYNTIAIQKATKIAETLVFKGQSKEMLSKKVFYALQDKAQSLLEQWKQEVLETLTAHKSVLEALSLALRNHKILPGKLLNLIVERHDDKEIQQFVKMSAVNLPGTSGVSLKELAEGLQTIVENNPV